MIRRAFLKSLLGVVAAVYAPASLLRVDPWAGCHRNPSEAEIRQMIDDAVQHIGSMRFKQMAEMIQDSEVYQRLVPRSAMSVARRGVGAG
jgi:hypothetical protein